MNKTNIFKIIFQRKSVLILLLFAIMITNPVLTTSGAAKGLLLWFNSIIPSLLPMLIITNIIIKYYGKLFKNPDLYIIALGLFCGYPMGAAAIAEFDKNSSYTAESRRKQQLLLAACNISSPSFVISYIYASALSSSIPIWKFLFIVYAPTILIIGIRYLFDIRIFHREEKQQSNFSKTSSKDSVVRASSMESSKIQNTHDTHNTQNTFIKTLDDSIMNSFETIIKLGGYIMLFSIFAAYISQLPIDNLLLKSFLTGTLEITTGIDYVKNAALSSDLKILLIIVINAFGGLSCAAQTNSVICQTDYSIKKYICHKILIAAIAGLVGYFMIYVL